MTLDALGTWVMGAYLLSVVPLALAWLVSHALGRQRASVRHHVWVMALTIALLAPAATGIAPRIDVPVLWTPALPHGTIEWSTSRVDLTAAEDAGSRHQDSRSRPTAAVMAIAWLAGAIPLLFVYALRRTRLARIATKARALDESPRVRTHEQVVVPMLAGLRRPTILLPAASTLWPRHELEAVLAHERAHLARRDHIIALVCEAATTFYWLNPLAWMAAVALEHERERACDEEVLCGGVRPSVYAAAMLRVAQGLPERAWMIGSPAMAGSRLNARVRAVLADAPPSSGRVPLSWPRTAALVIPCALLMATVHLVARAPTTPIAAGASRLPTVVQLPPAPMTSDALRPKPAVRTQSSVAGDQSVTFLGSLLDTFGRVLPDKPMMLTNTVTDARHESRSDQTGHFTFTGLAAGEYDLDAPVPGFTTRYHVTLRAGQQVQRDITLQLGSIKETITVTSAPRPERTPPQVVDLPPYRPESSRCADGGPLSSGGCIEPPLKVRDVRPRYPQDRLDISARVVLEGRIGTDGLIKALRVVEPADPDFAAAAAEAVGQWQFTPTRLDGVTVEVGITVNIRFSVQ